MGEVCRMSGFVVDVKVIIAHPISNNVGICLLNADEGVIQTVGTAPQ
jgi:hypothetical protein